ncbi:MAG TPA: glutamine--tRNA ligase/YqeY domain fusion protein [Kofleriaceae bacterium]|nr:glutamine--tRNA ligase/YqeY domain fusion protein [Kofleriaceae bacterium]
MASERNDFIRDIIDDDLRTGRHVQVATRFPPEPNGYLHIGHAKSICLNFGIARDYRGTCNLRYDDTNPAKEDVEYVESIERDVRWLGFAPTAVLFSADYFPRMYELAERLVRDGLAYVCDLDDEQIRAYRGTLSEPGRPSPFRDRPAAESLDLLRRMKAGEFPDGARTLRAKIDMASANMKMRDPLLYRIRHASHHRTGDAWCIYPMYDYAHPLEDAIEGITHSICTLEFENNRELYDWVLDHTGPWTPRPHQYEFARLALDYTVMSKRKLLQLVQQHHVSGWDDPRMPTLSGMRRRGYAPEAIRAFCDMIGVAKTNSMVDIGKLEYCVRDELNRNAPRVLGVLDPIEVEVAGDIAASSADAPYFPADVAKPGSRALPIGARIYIDRDDWRDDPPPDYKRLAPGRTVRLRHGYAMTADEVIARDGDGRPTRLRARVAEGGKGLAVIHWVDAATSVPAEVRLYDRLFKSAKPEEGGGDFLEQLAPDSLQVVRTARVEASLARAEVGSRWQLERVGYFRIDEDSRPGALVLDRITTLREREVSQPIPKPDKERKENAKAKTRPKSKSPAEYRAEARARDGELAAAYDQARALGIPDEQADLLTGDRATAALFVATAQRTGAAELVAKWMINELPRALGDRDAGALDAARLAELIELLRDGKLTPAAGKAVLGQMVTTGQRAGELAARTAAPAGDLGAAVDAVIAANPDKAAQYKAGKTGLLGFFVGQVMRSAPNADAAAVNQAVRDRLG